MGTYQDCYLVASSTLFQSRVWASAAQNMVQTVYGEASTLNPPQHGYRVTYGRTIFGLGFPIFGISMAVISLSSIAGLVVNSSTATSTVTGQVNNNVTDADILNGVQQVWNALAGTS